MDEVCVWNLLKNVQHLGFRQDGTTLECYTSENFHLWLWWFWAKYQKYGLYIAEESTRTVHLHAYDWPIQRFDKVTLWCRKSWTRSNFFLHTMLHRFLGFSWCKPFPSLKLKWNVMLQSDNENNEKNIENIIWWQHHKLVTYTGYCSATLDLIQF